VTGPGKVAGKYERMGAHAGMPLYQGAFMCLLGPLGNTNSCNSLEMLRAFLRREFEDAA